MTLFYHFTSTQHLPFILEDGMLRPGESNIGSIMPGQHPFGEHYGPDVVWLLDTPERPSTGLTEVNHGLAHDSLDKTAVRFTVNVPAIHWKSWLPAVEMHPKWRAALLLAAGGEDAADHWYVLPAPIRDKRWVEVRNMETDEVLLDSALAGEGVG